MLLVLPAAVIAVEYPTAQRALIAGNAIVVKPSEVVPLSGEFVVTAIMGGLNDRFPGLVSLLQGDGDVRGVRHRATTHSANACPPGPWCRLSWL